MASSSSCLKLGPELLACLGLVDADHQLGLFVNWDVTQKYPNLEICDRKNPRNRRSSVIGAPWRISCEIWGACHLESWEMTRGGNAVGFARGLVDWLIQVRVLGDRTRNSTSKQQHRLETGQHKWHEAALWSITQFQYLKVLSNLAYWLWVALQIIETCSNYTNSSNSINLTWLSWCIFLGGSRYAVNLLTHAAGLLGKSSEPRYTIISCLRFSHVFDCFRSKNDFAWLLLSSYFFVSTCLFLHQLFAIWKLSSTPNPPSHGAARSWTCPGCPGESAWPPWVTCRTPWASFLVRRLDSSNVQLRFFSDVFGWNQRFINESFGMNDLTVLPVQMLVFPNISKICSSQIKDGCLKIDQANIQTMVEFVFTNTRFSFFFYTL